jgi:hypothetical protein
MICSALPGSMTDGADRPRELNHPAAKAQAAKPFEPAPEPERSSRRAAGGKETAANTAKHEISNA